MGALAIALMSLAAGCSVLPGLGRAGGTYPEACASLGFEARRCAAIVERAIGDPSALGPGKTAVIYAPNVQRGVTLGGHVVAEVGVRDADGSENVADVWCHIVGSEDDLACSEEPHIRLDVGVDQDVPCGPDGTPDECATLPPVPGPSARALGQPLRVPELAVPVDHLGHYEVLVGTAALPNGYLTERSATLADAQPNDFWIAGGVSLQVRSTVGARPPIGSVYRDPYPGPEPVRVYLVFDVVDTSPGAVLRVRDIVVS